jgi:hypothetical protein
MIIRKALVALASAGLVLGSTAHAAAALPAENARVSSPVAESENLRGWFWILIAVVGIAALGVTLFDNDEPQSP